MFVILQLGKGREIELPNLFLSQDLTIGGSCYKNVLMWFYSAFRFSSAIRMWLVAFVPFYLSLFSHVSNSCGYRATILSAQL